MWHHRLHFDPCASHVSEVFQQVFGKELVERRILDPFEAVHPSP
jgi:hypothetical protein